jgi:hypothetical protein
LHIVWGFHIEKGVDMALTHYFYLVLPHLKDYVVHSPDSALPLDLYGLSHILGYSPDPWVSSCQQSCGWEMDKSIKIEFILLLLSPFNQYNSEK